MFSGIIQYMGQVQSVRRHGTTLSLVVASPVSDQLKTDQSVSHDGVCLTVVETGKGTHTVEIVLETQSKTTFDQIEPGRLLNLECSVTPTSLLDGHLVQGHVDTALSCLDKKDLDGSWRYSFALPMEFAHLVIPHGSICLNGVSLTVANLFEDSFDIAIIPYTYAHTNFRMIQPGDRVNAEFDLIGKYIARLIKKGTP